MLSKMSFPDDPKRSTVYGKNASKMQIKKRKDTGGRLDGTKPSRKSAAKRSNLWVPRVRHNYVPVRPNSYTVVNTNPSQVGKTIPFVCGQSISKTHNIGLKIQETLNAIKQEKSKANKPLYKAQVPRVYTHNYSHSGSRNDVSRTPTFRPSSMSRRKPVDTNFLKAVFLELYQDLTKTMEDLQGLRKNPRSPESFKMAETLEQTIKKKELQISVTMALYKEVMYLRKALGIKPDKPIKTKQFTFPSDPSKKNIVYNKLKEFQSGDH